ncbi:hypothetical protein V8E55_003230 [Tylopilus felleus]
MDSLRLVVPPHPKLPSTSQDAQLSDVGHVDHERQVRKQFGTDADGIWRKPADRPATLTGYTQKVDVDVEKRGSSHEASMRGRELTLRTILTAVSGVFKRPRTKNVIAVHPEIEQLRQEITALQRRCASLEDANNSEYGSCHSSTLDILQGPQRSNAEISQHTVSLSENSDVIAQADVIPLDTNGQSVLSRQQPVARVLAGAEGCVEVKDVELASQPTMSSRVTKDEPSTPLGKMESAVLPTTRGSTPVPTVTRADHDGGLFDTSKVVNAQFLQTGQDMLPVQKDEEVDAEATAESEPQPKQIDQERLPRKKHGSEESEVESLLPLPYQERLPRKR